MRVLVTGDRDWTDLVVILDRLSELPSGTVIIHGACRGADKLAGEAAQLLGFSIIEYPAEWGKYGRAAGPIRNRQMLEEGQPNLVLGFHDNISESKGTKNVLAISEKAGIDCELHTQQGKILCTS